MLSVTVAPWMIGLTIICEVAVLEMSSQQYKMPLSLQNITAVQ